MSQTDKIQLSPNGEKVCSIHFEPFIRSKLFKTLLIYLKIQYLV